jgi:hypothetical protein
MLARLATAALVGLTAHPVGVEVDIGRGLPAVTVVGLGGTAVLEARDRLRAAFGNTGYEWPDRRITVSLPPADLPKQGSGFDLAAAGPDHGYDVEADAARPVRGGPEVGPGQPAELGLLGGVDGGRGRAVADTPPGLDLAEHQQPRAFGDHVDLTRLAAPVAGHDPQAGGGQPGAGERFAAPAQLAAIGGVPGCHGPDPSRGHSRIGRLRRECG